jgi:hypothetical protein
MDNKITQLDYIKTINKYRSAYPQKFSKFEIYQNATNSTVMHGDDIQIEHVAANKNYAILVFYDSQNKYKIINKPQLNTVLNIICSNDSYVNTLYNYAKSELKEV